VTTLTSVNVVHATACPDIGPICATRDEPPQLHDQDFTLGELRLRAAYGIRDWLGVELVVRPVLFAGLRVATVANISLVSVGALIGSGGLGNLFTGGFQLGFIEPIIIGIVLSMLLAGLCDVGLVLLQRRVTPWARVGSRA
jgi:hypothetical protein